MEAFPLKTGLASF
jgi:hypothetical protein